MRVRFICQDAGFACDAVIEGETTDDVLTQAGKHVQDHHGVEVTPQREDQLRQLVQEAWR